jgi:Tfp pilus assembly protein PilZ
MPERHSPRIVPPAPITVAIEEDGGPLLAYGVIADISGSGACVWTDAHLAIGSTLHFRISFAHPPEVHELAGAVVWIRDDRNRTRNNAFQCGIEWLGATQACRIRLRALAQRAVPPSQPGRQPFEKAWVVLDT